MSAEIPAVRQAAMYVRMSTDHQKYSTENQADAIREYAARYNMEIVETYADQGKSGLSLEGRDALKRLIDDVQAKRTNFTVILVLDVTRWGRFQDADESAYYEYICRSAGIDVQYVAEQFENDGSPVSTIVKGVKRAMAGEYSRELSGKVFAGQCRLIELGYRQGGPAGYGLRRMLIDEQGQEKGLLKRGEHKSLQTDRVILVPGPDEEIEIVRWIYRSFVDENKNESQLAALLNQRGITTDWDRPWTRGTVHQVLTNEKYIGNNIFNRTSFKLKKRRVENEPEMWVRADGVFEGIVDPKYFYTAHTSVTCLVSTDDEAFTYNRHISRLSSIQEHKMIAKAIERGVSEEKIAKALDVNVDVIVTKRYLLKGICPEVVELLKDKMVSGPVFPILRRMTPNRQIEVATIMNDTCILQHWRWRSLIRH